MPVHDTAYIDSAEYSSWEFFTSLIERVTADTSFAYSEPHLSEPWTHSTNANKVMELIAKGNVR